MVFIFYLLLRKFGKKCYWWRIRERKVLFYRYIFVTYERTLPGGRGRGSYPVCLSIFVKNHMRRITHKWVGTPPHHHHHPHHTISHLFHQKIIGHVPANCIDFSWGIPYNGVRGCANSGSSYFSSGQPPPVKILCHLLI